MRGYSISWEMPTLLRKMSYKLITVSNPDCTDLYYLTGCYSSGVLDCLFVVDFMCKHATEEWRIDYCMLADYACHTTNIYHQ